jgi:hypothetical protein
VGISHYTAEFAVTAIQLWWEKLGRKCFPKVKRVVVTADCGGSAPCTRIWRLELQRLPNETGLQVEVCHFAPGTSKWNRIEHCFFCRITRNWQGLRLETLEIVVNLIGVTTARQELEVHAWLDDAEYPISRTVSDKQLLDMQIQRNKFTANGMYKNTKLRLTDPIGYCIADHLHSSPCARTWAWYLPDPPSPAPFPGPISAERHESPREVLQPAPERQ